MTRDLGLSAPEEWFEQPPIHLDPPITESTRIRGGYGEYTIVRAEPLGTGAFGAVFEAVDDFDARRAVKFISFTRADGSPLPAAVREVQEARAMREATILRQEAGPDAPHVVRVFDHGRWGRSAFFIVMDLIRGRHLSTVGESSGPMMIEWLLGPLGDIAEALDWCASRLDKDGNPDPIVHRDVSPDNVMIGDDGRATLVDFGGALRQSSAKFTKTNYALGKFGFRAPEVLAGARPTPNSDVWSLAAVMYWGLTGFAPSPGDARPPSQIVRNACPARIDGAVLAGLDPSTERRPVTATAFIREVEAALERPAAAERLLDISVTVATVVAFGLAGWFGADVIGF